MISDFQKIQMLLGNLFPFSLAPDRRTDFTVQEKKKYERIRSIVVEVGEKVGIAYPEKVDFRITKKFAQNACMVGNVISLSGPVMCLANDYFTDYDSPELLQNPEYRAWRKCLNSIPDHPLEMEKWLSSLSLEGRRSLSELTKKFESALSEEELKGLTAHELGHAKHLHTWKRLFFLLPMSWGAVKVMHHAGPFFGNIAFYLPFAILFSLGINQITQMFEKEADEETSVSSSYNAGLKSFFKRMTIIQLTKDFQPSAHKVRSMIEGFDYGSHPHPAKRVIAAIERKEKAALPISLCEKGIALVGGALLVHEVAGMVASVYNTLFGKKKKITSRSYDPIG